jgi:hypothetical protein
MLAAGAVDTAFCLHRSSLRSAASPNVLRVRLRLTLPLTGDTGETSRQCARTRFISASLVGLSIPSPMGMERKDTNFTRVPRGASPSIHAAAARCRVRRGCRRVTYLIPSSRSRSASSHVRAMMEFVRTSRTAYGPYSHS